MLPVSLSTAVRAGFLALLFGLAAALMASTARGAAPEERSQKTEDRAELTFCPPSSGLCPLASVAPLGEEWSWRGFLKYWERQTIGRTSGIVGIVLLVAAGAALLILSKSK
jgi:hypothetical protein